MTLDVRGIINDIPDSLTTNCPNSDASPLDLILRQYLHGEATIFVKGHAEQPGDTPKWIGDILSNIILPVPFPGRTFDSLIRNFSLADVEFSFDDDLDPQVSGTIVVLAALPREMNFAINVTDARAAADVLYKKRKVGELNVPEWQPANSSKIESEDKKPMLEIQSRIIDAPLHITNQTVFEEVVHAMLVGDKPVLLDIDAAVDVRVETALGPLVLKEVPAKGTVPVKRPFSLFQPVLRRLL